MSPVKVSETQVEKICKRGQGEHCCSYLIIGGVDGWCCAKSSHFAFMISQRRLEGTMRAMGDNCSGPPDFLYTEGGLPGENE